MTTKTKEATRIDEAINISDNGCRDEETSDARAELAALRADRELLRAYGLARVAYDGPGCRQHDLPESDAIAARADELALGSGHGRRT
jgi:hypothetical protein